MFGLPHAARLVESENADAAECTAGVPGMPFEPAIGGDGAKWGFGNGRAGDSRPEQPALPELHQLPPESTWLQCEPGLIQMRLLLALLLMVPAFAQQPDPPTKTGDQTAQAPAKAPDKPADKPADTTQHCASQWPVGRARIP